MSATTLPTLGQTTRFREPPLGDIRRLEHAMELTTIFRVIDPRLPVSYLQAFLAVARAPGLSTSQYAEMCGTTQPVMSRMLLEMGDKSRMRDEGLQLVDYDRDRGDLRKTRYFLTDKGKELFKRFTALYKRYERRVAQVGLED